ncbi:hypothetical protein MPH_09201 [Macrophomina phaseolina MS6]|uniref:Uncharacterized protein n=1 Tax=Macrophomina phaseolina (strain MS6) TaxID=1126212 RepID=K2SA29_MACPH|nr:hypothetical protein MPH_09201 [Macrophomina phaseolina MS6]
MDDGERELPLGQVLAESFVFGVRIALKIEVVVSDLENVPQQIDKGNVVARRSPPISFARHLHQLDRQPEEAAGLVGHHGQIFFLGRADQRIPPVEIHALATVQIQQLLGEYLKRPSVPQLGQFLLRQEVGIVGRVDRLRDAEDTVRHGQPATQFGRILDVIDPGAHGQDVRQDGGRALRTEGTQCAAAPLCV